CGGSAACTNGRCPLEVLATAQVNPSSVVVDGSGVYFTTFATSGNVVARPTGATSTTNVVTKQSFPSSLASDGTSLYWTNYFGGTVVKSAKDGSGVTVL